MIYWLVKLILKMLLTPIFRFSFENTDSVPESGPVIIASNHKSWIDPVAIGIALKRKINFMAKAELFKYPVFGWLIHKLGAFPVKRGAGDISAVKSSLRILRENRVLGIFVEGTRVKTEGIGELKPGVYAIAKLSKSPVILCAIKGSRPLFKRKLPPIPSKIKLKFEPFEIDPLQFDQESYLVEMRKVLERMYYELDG